MINQSPYKMIPYKKHDRNGHVIPALNRSIKLGFQSMQPVGLGSSSLNQASIKTQTVKYLASKSYSKRAVYRYCT